MCELKLKKVNKLIKKVLKGKVFLPKEAFQTLLLTALSLKEQEMGVKPVLLTPPPRVVIKKVSSPKRINVSNNLKISKDPNMSNCISEMVYNPLYLKMQVICEVC